MRLIDADKIKAQDLCDICNSADCSNCFSYNDFVQWIDNQPTAYNMKAVVEHLENEKEDDSHSLTYEHDIFMHGYNSGLTEAIEIVKKGGVADES